MKVITIHEENHGFIGTAATMKAAFQFLIKENWLTPAFDLYDEATGAWYTLADVFESKGIALTRKNILAWAMEYAEDAMFWDGAFYFHEDAIYDEEDWDPEYVTCNECAMREDCEDKESRDGCYLGVKEEKDDETLDR